MANYFFDQINVQSGGGNDVITFTGQGAVQGGDGDDTINAGGSSANNLIDGGNGNDSLLGGTGADTITAGAGNDTVNGGGGADVLSGQGGADVFVLGAGSSPPSAGSAGVTHITDWVSTDSVKFGAVGTGIGFYHNDSLTATSFNNAIGVANADLAGAHGGTDKYSAVQVGSDVVVFVDSNGDHVVDDAIILTGKSLTDIAGSNFI